MNSYQNPESVSRVLFTTETTINSNNSNVNERTETNRGILLIIFLFISYCTVFISIVIIFIQIYSIAVKIYYYNELDDINISRFIIQFYTIAIACGIILTELEITDIMRNIVLLQSWFYRGLLYIFCGLLSNIENTDQLVYLQLDNLSQLLNVSSIILIFLGIIYSIMVIIYINKLILINK
jgi:hypothetical protein